MAGGHHACFRSLLLDHRVSTSALGKSHQAVERLSWGRTQNVGFLRFRAGTGQTAIGPKRAIPRRRRELLLLALPRSSFARKTESGAPAEVAVRMLRTDWRQRRVVHLAYTPTEPPEPWFKNGPLTI